MPITAKELAKKLKLSQTAVSMALNNKPGVSTETRRMVVEAAEKYGSRGAKQAQQLTEEVTGLFAGGEMAQEDMDVMMKAIQDAYWIAKEKNKKYTPKKYRSEE